jgi:hypothetical protein
MKEGTLGEFFFYFVDKSLIISGSCRGGEQRHDINKIIGRDQ